MGGHDLGQLRFVKRIVVGTDDPARVQTASDIRAAQAQLNRCIAEGSGGKIIGIEKGFALLQIGEHQIVLQWLCYHVGFQRKPFWLHA